MDRLKSIFPIFLVTITLNIRASGGVCPPAFCISDGLEIHFPFRLDSQPQHCGYPGFVLSCKGNQTVLHLPSSKQEFEVTSIDYETQRLLISYQYDCFMAFIFNVNLSTSPYTYDPLNYDPSLYDDLSLYYYYRNPSLLQQYYHQILHRYNFTFINCSRDVRSDRFDEIACMGSSNHHISIVATDMDLSGLPMSCKPIKRVEIPFISRFGNVDIDSFSFRRGYPPLLRDYYQRADYSFLRLSWNVPECRFCILSGGRCEFENETTCVFSQKGPLVPPEYVVPLENHKGSLSPSHKGLSMKPVIAGATIGFILLVVATIAATKFSMSWKSKRKKDAENQLKVEKFLEDYKILRPTRYSYADIKRITNQFKSKLGQGGYGSVYKGNLPNDVSVAVKILKRFSEEGEDFINEVGTIGRIHHVNVVRLLGFCADGYERALIYEFMPNESLEKFIFSKDSKIPSLGWEKLQNIAIGIARGMEYLHQGCDQRILHFDIKPHNILLDQNFNPKISDFGLAKLCSKEQSIVSMSVAKGTVGYIAPEVISRNFGNVSYKSDVYSFGMVLLEMVGGRKNTNVNAENSSQVYFPEWIYTRLHQGDEIELEIADEEDAMIAKKLSIIALWCIQWYPVDRPSMKRVIQMLEGSMESLVMPPNPFGSTSIREISAALPKKPQSTQLTVIVE